MLTLVLIRKGSQEDPQYWTVPWELGGQPSEAEAFPADQHKVPGQVDDLK